MGVLAALKRLVVTGSGQPLPDAFVSIDANEVALATAIDSNTARLTALERGPMPPGGYMLGPDSAAAVFANYSQIAGGWSTATRKAAVQPPISAGFCNDSYGKTAISVVSPTRFMFCCMDTNGITPSDDPWYRATLYDVAADGSLTQRATTSFRGASFAGQAYPNFAGVMGVEYSGANTWRVTTVMENPGYPYRAYAIGTLQWDGSSTTLTATRDIQNYGGGGQNYSVGSVHNNGNHRKRMFRTGNASYFCPIVSWNTCFVYGQPIDIMLGGISTERSAGSTFANYPQLFDNHRVGVGYSMDACGDNTFVVLRPGYIAGSGQGNDPRAIVSLVRADDAQQSLVSSVNLGNVPTGNMRITALSATLFVAGYATSAGYASYLIQRDATTNALIVIGAMGNGAPMNGGYDEAVYHSPTKLAQLRRAVSGSTINVETIQCDATVGSGASPFTLLKTASMLVGQAFGGAAPGDDCYLTAVGRLGPDRLVIGVKNNTRNTFSLEVWDLT